VTALGKFEDHRGVIEDMIGRIDSVTRITTVAGAVRGNHYHEHTTQWTLLASGSLLMATGESMKIMRPGQVIKHDPGVPHAWKAISDCECWVFTKGPRSGEDYESDVIRLKEPLL
jgi:quercetin dioxygenase-like cupin family protein